MSLFNTWCQCLCLLFKILNNFIFYNIHYYFLYSLLFLITSFQWGSFTQQSANCLCFIIILFNFIFLIKIIENRVGKSDFLWLQILPHTICFNFQFYPKIKFYITRVFWKKILIQWNRTEDVLRHPPMDVHMFQLKKKISKCQLISWWSLWVKCKRSTQIPEMSVSATVFILKQLHCSSQSIRKICLHF